MARIVRVRAIIPLEDKVLFVQHAPHSEYWALPGGRLEAGEALIDGLTREIMEELGVVPKVGKLLYVQQFFQKDDESLEFFYEVTNGAAFENINLSQTTHGAVELSRVAFISPDKEYVLPGFLKNLAADIKKADWPIVTIS